MATSRKKIVHGTINTYTRHGCRCDACRRVNADKIQAYREKNRERFRAASRASYHKKREYWNERKKAAYDPVKTHARNQAKYAIRKGRLVRGECERHGDDCSGQIHAHHDDYSKPLDVRWFCVRHHRLHHLEHGWPE